MKFRNAVAVAANAAMATTANGMPTHVTSTVPTVDLFFAIGSSRGKDITSMFEAAYAHDRVTTLRMLLWARDIRGGAGERDTARNLLMWLAAMRPHEVESLIPHLATFGRWDDLLIFDGALQNAAFSVIQQGLSDPKTAALVGKWMPRKQSRSPSARSKTKKNGTIVTTERRPFSAKRERKRQTAEALRKFLGLTPGDYRRLLAKLSTAVEQQMSAGSWDAIEFGKLPSLASARYQKAFNRRAAGRYADYKAALAAGEEKVNAKAIYPYDVIKSINAGDAVVAKAQWEALPNYLGDDRILPMVDVSGSMSSPVRGSKALTCMDVAVSLGLYVADKQSGAFKDCFLTFSQKPKLQVLKGDIISKQAQLRRSEWGMNTNLEAAFKEVLRVAKSGKVPADEMPRIVLILSDMEFDACVHDASETAFGMMRREYEAAGYALPRVVFWNLNARQGNVPVQSREGGTALVSGFSPAIMKSVLRAADFSPEGIMRETLNAPRYASVVA